MKLWCSFTVLLRARRSQTEQKGREKYKKNRVQQEGEKVVYLGVKDRHNSVFGFPHVLPPSTHLDVGICSDRKDRDFSMLTGVRHEEHRHNVSVTRAKPGSSNTTQQARAWPSQLLGDICRKLHHCGARRRAALQSAQTED